MLSRLLCILTLLSPLAGQAKIIETAHVADVISLIDENSWFLVDLDNTLFEAKQALGHVNWFYDRVLKKMQDGMERDEAIWDTHPEWRRLQQVCSVKPLEEDFVPSLIALQERGIVVMGLTHREPLVAPSTIRQVASLGVDFTKTAPSQSSFTIPAINPALYQEGILFVHDFNKKGSIFLTFLSMIQQSPRRVVFIDDKRKNVEELENTLSDYGIEYIGVHYTAIEHAKPVYSRELAEFQSKFLDKIMSNEAALLLMEHGLE